MGRTAGKNATHHDHEPEGPNEPAVYRRGASVVSMGNTQQETPTRRTTEVYEPEEVGTPVTMKVGRGFYDPKSTGEPVTKDLKEDRHLPAAGPAHFVGPRSNVR